MVEAEASAPLIPISYCCNHGGANGATPTGDVGGRSQYAWVN